MTHKHSKILYRIICVLALLMFTSCEHGETGYAYANSLEENYYLRGASFELPDELAESASIEIQRRLGAILLDCGLRYRVSYKQDYTAIQDSDLFALWGDGSQEDNPMNAGRQDPYGEGSIPPGTLEIIGDKVSLRLTMPATQSSMSTLSLHGSFSLSEGQAAINKLRNDAYPENAIQTGQLGNQQFPIQWELSGSLDGEPFTHTVLQQFRIHRIRYSTPI